MLSKEKRNKNQRNFTKSHPGYHLKYINKRKEHWKNNDPYSIKTEKRCHVCLLSLSRQLFHRNSNSSDGLTGKCKSCHTISSKIQRRSGNSLKVHLLAGARLRSRKTGRKFNLTLNDIIVPEVCPVLGIELKINNNKCGPNSPSLDRIDNNEGYVSGNIRVISHRANSLKSNATYNELLLILEDLRRINVKY